MEWAECYFSWTFAYAGGKREELNFAIYKRCCEQEKLIV
jgi:hypothetical protein